MIQKVEFIKFNKKPCINIAKAYMNLNDKKNYSLKKEKEYSQLYIKILNSNKSSNINRIKSTIDINTKKNENHNNLFDTFEYKNIYSSQSNINKFSSSANKKAINQKSSIKLSKNINNGVCSKKKNQNKEILISNKNVPKLEKNNFISKDKKSNLNNQKLKIPYNKTKQMVKSRNLKKKSKENEQKNQREKAETKTIMLPKEKTYQRQFDEIISNSKNKQLIKNNIKIKKVDILNDNNSTLESNKEKNNLNKFCVNYIYTKKFKNNYEIKIQNSPKFGGTSQKIKKMNKTIICNKKKRKIKESPNTIDLYINKNYIKNETDNKILNKENGDERKSLKNNYLTDNSRSIRKLSKNKTEMNTMNTTRLIDNQTTFDLNRNSVKIIKSNSLRHQKKKCLNISAKIKLKIRQSYKNNNVKKFQEEYSAKNIKYINLNYKNKSNSKRIVNIKIKDIDGILSDEIEKFKAIYPATDSEVSLLDEKRNNYRPRFYSVRKEISLSKERDKKRENSTMRINEDINNVEKKLSSLVSDFHNNLKDFNKNLSIHKSRKLIDRIRMKRKLNLI